ncbi:hypothetical protein HDU97_007636 [Phlyctochytrium planicorne]|nr:hypothetical protein HDU97_007636 [Phlyctochytrium planicorne]
MALPNLASPLKLGSLTLKNRLVLSSMTRNRAVDSSIPTDSMVTFYKQRSSAGLLLTEGIFIEPQGGEWPHAPGIWNKAQVAGWKKVVDAVHAEKSLIFAQIWHIGRVAHPLHQAGQPNVGPSAIAAKGGKFRLLDGHPGYVQPKAIEDPKVYVEKYRQAAINAKEAGFDGIELHAANGYLPNQFLESHSNQRKDAYGGSIQNQSRFILEIIRTFIEVYGDSTRVGIKLSPRGGYNDMGEPLEVAKELYGYLIKELDGLKIGYIQLAWLNAELDPATRGNKIDVMKELAPLVKNAKLFVNGNLTGPTAEAMLEPKNAKPIDAAVFGRPFIANPNLLELLQTGGELKVPDFSKLYTSGDDGYILL